MDRACSAAREHRYQLRLLAGLLGQLGQPVLDRLEIGQDQLGVDGLDVVDGRDLAVHMDDIGVGEDPDHLADGIALADGGQELVAQPLAHRRALHDAGDVHERDHGRHDLLALEELGQPGEPLVGHRHHAHVGVDGGERIVGRQDLVTGQGVEQGGLPDVGEADDADGQSHWCFLR